MRRSAKLVFLLSLFALACAKERAPIDRTQPNALDKHDFAGEWYYGRTVVDVPPALSPTFVGNTTYQGLDRVRWDVQENYLYARRSFEKVKNADVTYTTDDKGAVTIAPGVSDPNYKGAVVAAYPIISHFDIKRAYNPTTGEEYNVLEENSSDRPWYERRYMRVDWSVNRASNFEFLLEVDQEPISYYVQDNKENPDKDAPVFDPPQYDAAGKLTHRGYFDITNALMYSPKTITLPYFDFKIPFCLFFGRETEECTSAPLKVRHAFWQVDPDHQYVPQPFKGKVTDHFGIITVDRLKYDPEQGINERNRETWAQLHNLWKKWLDDEGNVLAPKDRGVQPMVYYAIGWPDDLMPVLKSVEKAWNEIFQRVVAAAIGQDKYDGQVFRICHSPVRDDDDHDLCGETGFAARIGDIRYSSVVYVPEFYDGFRLLGFGPSNVDPLTGEVLSASAYLYSWNNIVTQTAIEQLQLLNGDIDPFQYIDGVDLTPWQRQAQKDKSSRRVVSQEDIRGYLKGQNFQWAKGLAGQLTPEERAGYAKMSLDEAVQKADKRLYDMGLFNGTRNDSDGRLSSLRGTYIENLLMNNEMKMQAGILPGTPNASITGDALTDASVVRMGPIKFQRALEKAHEQIALAHGLDLAEPVDDGLVGIADQYKGMTQDQMRPLIRDNIYHAVLSHELGHTFSLYHNFGGTEDALNYQDEYWKLRSADGTVEPRYKDPVNDMERDGQIYKYATSSIMDYSRLTLDYAPGKYDAAAVMLGYAGKVEVFVDQGRAPDKALKDWAELDGASLEFHYTQWWKDMGELMYQPENRVLVDARECRNSDDTECMDWSRGMLVKADSSTAQRVPYVFCGLFQNDISTHCFTRDYGADIYERVTNHLAETKTWYVTRAFTRYRYGSFFPSSYVGRVYARVYERLKHFNDTYAFYAGIFASIGFAVDDPQVLSDYPELEGFAIATHDILNQLLETIATPDISNFSKATDAAGLSYLRKSNFGSFATDVSNGRYFTTEFAGVNGTDGTSDCGMWFTQCLHHFGFYLEKMMALETLTDSQTFFVARDTAADIREFRISFWDDYSDVLNNFFGGIMAEDYPTFAPHLVDDSSTLVYPDYGSAASAKCPVGKPGCTLTPLDPETGFTVQLFSAVMGMARLQNNFDKSFLDSTRMWIDGSFGEIKTDLSTVDYTDPISGKTYKAIDMDGTDGPHLGVAKRMLERANAVYLRSNYCSGVLCDDAVADNPATAMVDEHEAERAAADGEIVKYGQLLDILGDLAGYYETNTQDYGNDPYNPG